MGKADTYSVGFVIEMISVRWGDCDSVVWEKGAVLFIIHALPRNVNRKNTKPNNSLWNGRQERQLVQGT